MKTPNSIHQIVLPINLEIIIPIDDSVRLLYELTEELNYKKLYKSYSTIGRNPAISPKSLFRVLVYGYMEGIYSSRALEKACRRDINFRWLLQGEKVPSHNTISRFRSIRLESCIEDLFYQLVKKLNDLGEIEYDNLFVDGTKIEANANKYTFVWRKSVNKFEERLQSKIKQLLIKVENIIDEKLDFIKDTISISDAQIILNKLENYIELNNITFVSGKGKRKSEVQKYYEIVKYFIEKQKEYNDYNKTFKGRNSFSKTDKDATFMHMKEDHMKNGQLKPGYNVQIGVESEYIVGVDISSERADQLTLIPFLDKLEDNISNKYNSITADAGYESEENYKRLEENNQLAYIKPQNYNKIRDKKFKKDISKRENMLFNEEDNCFICANDRKLLYKGLVIKNSKSGYQSEVSVYESESCNGCELKDKCTKAKGNKQIYFSKTFDKLRKKSINNLNSEKGIIYRVNRSIQVEGAFGVIKQYLGFRRFLLRGNDNVKIEFLLLCFGYNIKKYLNKTTKNRLKTSLHKVYIA